MANFLYTLIIYPIEQIIEICFFYCTTWFGSPGVSILGVSVAVSTAILPIYLMADAQQRRQREIEKGLDKGVSLIKSVFKGDERFMLLSTYYRQNNYHPIYALRNSIDLLIQIPFFIAAYHFLSHLDVLKGASFLFINDLGSPDKLLFGFNLLPVLMTIINVVSGMVYARGLKSKDKIQLYAMAGVFLVLLYNSPAGLVLYWTSNNIYNLIKNIIQKYAVGSKSKQESKPTSNTDNALNDPKTFVLALVTLALLIGLVIPASVISSSVAEFSQAVSGDLVSPIRFVIHTVMQSAGFLFWGVGLYLLFQSKVRRVLTVAAVSLLIMSVMDTFVYWKDYGFLTEELVLSAYVRPGPPEQNSTLAVILALSGAAYFLMRIKYKQIIMSLLVIASVSFAVYGATHIATITNDFALLSKSADTQKSVDADTGDELGFRLSRGGKNVLVIMLDRAQGQHVSAVFEEKTELRKTYSGFTHYPNMVTFGGHTFIAAPALFGGYYYTPDAIQARTNETLLEKHDQGMQVIPRIMAENGFDAVAANIPFTKESDEAFVRELFSDQENIEAVDIRDRYFEQYLRDRRAGSGGVEARDYDPVVRKNLIQFAFFKCSPLAMRTKVYNHGSYMNADSDYRNVDVNYTKEFLKNYLSLKRWPEITEISDDDRNNCAVAVSDIVHAPSFLQYPDYEPAPVVTNRGAGVFAGDPHYHVTVLALILLDKWFDHLKNNGVWDNTRIIIVSDHGNTDIINRVPENITLPNGGKLQRFHGVLLVKDFGASGDLSVDSAFMTSADVPTIAVKDIIENPVNPFTRKPLHTDKDNGVFIPTAGWMPTSKHGEYRYNIKSNEWLKVRDNIFKKENWSKHEFAE